MRIWNFLLRLWGLAFLLLGSLLALQDGFLIDWWQSTDLLWICGLTAVLVTLADSHWAGALAGNAAGGIAAFYLVGRYGVEIKTEWDHFLAAAVPLVNEYHYLSLPVGEQDWSRLSYDSRYGLFLAALGLGLLMGLGLAVKKLRLLAFVPVAIAFGSGLAVGNAPGVWAVICLICGLGICFAIPGRRTEPVVFKTSILTLVGLFFVLGIMAVLYQPLSEPLLKEHARLLKQQIQLEDRLLELTKGGHFLDRLRWSFEKNENQARLSDQTPSQGEDVVFEITVEERPEEPIYVKNFTSADYREGVWQAEEGETYAAFLKEQGIVPKEDLTREQEQLAEEKTVRELTRSYRCLEEKGLKSQRIRMDIKERTGNTTLWPYFCQIPSEARSVGDAGIRTGSGRYETRGYLLGTEQLSTYSYSVISASADTDRENRVEPETEYRDFLSVQSSRGDTPIPRLLKADPDGAYNALEECVYSFDLEPVPQGADAVEDFLFRQKKGYCMHFASAHTLIFQSILLPARYASGYVVFPEDFDKNEDGTYTAAVPRYRGHAWMEVYSLLFGWYPLEVTPPDYLNTLAQAGADTSPQELFSARGTRKEEQREPEQKEPKKPEEPKEQKEPKEPEQKESPLKEEEGTKKPAGDGQQKNREDRWWLLPVRVVSVMLLLAALAGLNLLRIRWIWRRREAAFGDEDTNRAAVALYRAMAGLLKIRRMEMEPQEGELTFARRVEEASGWMKPGQFVRAVGVLRAARFGEGLVEPTACRELLELYGRMMEETVGQMDQKSRIWYRFFHVKIRI